MPRYRLGVQLERPFTRFDAVITNPCFSTSYELLSC